MPDYSSITVSVSTYLIFRYHLPLSCIRGFLPKKNLKGFPVIIFGIEFKVFNVLIEVII
jgi:hypothetical protein